MSDYLFSKPSFLEGVARNIDLFGAIDAYNVSNTTGEADYRALKCDIDSLRKDMEFACAEVLDGDRG